MKFNLIQVIIHSSNIIVLKNVNSYINLHLDLSTATRDYEGFLNN